MSRPCKYFIFYILLHSAISTIGLAVSLDLYSKLTTGPSPQWYDLDMIRHSCHLISSYNDICGLELIPNGLTLLQQDPVAAAKALFFADRVVLSHGIQDGERGPILNYGNVAALKLWAASWEQLTSMPSSETAEPQERAVRAAFMDRIKEKGFADNYSGVRVALDGSRFQIDSAVVWNVIVDGQFLGQAATFPTWTYLPSAAERGGG